MKHKLLVIYDLRFTIYDLNASTLRAFLRNKSKAEFSKTMVR